MKLQKEEKRVKIKTKGYISISYGKGVTIGTAFLQTFYPCYEFSMLLQPYCSKDFIKASSNLISKHVLEDNCLVKKSRRKS